MRIKRVTGVLLVLCLCLALGSGAALAAEPIDLAGHADDLAVTVQLSDGNDKEIAADMANANIVIDLYKVAGATEAEGYDSIEFDFGSGLYKDLNLDAFSATVKVSNDDWLAFAQDAAALALNETDESKSGLVVKGADPGEKISLAGEGLGAGLYLLIAHGSDITDYVNDDGTTIARSAAWEYSFAPQMISVPSRGDDGDRATSNVGDEWDYAPNVILKFGREAMFGSLEINKTVTDFDGVPATFVFNIVDTETGGDVYKNVASIYYDEQTSTVVTHIPANIEVTVKETYEGARYRLVSENDVTATIVADAAVAAGADMASVSFVNEPKGSDIHGHGIENHFEYGGDAGFWQLTTTPGQAAVKGAE